MFNAKHVLVKKVINLKLKFQKNKIPFLNEICKNNSFT